MYDTGFVNLYTADIEAGLGFYRDLLGVRETFRTPTAGTPEHVELTLDGFTVGPGTVEAARRVHDAEASPGATSMEPVVWCDGVDAEVALPVGAGVALEREPHDSGNGHRSALVRDPDSNLVTVVSQVV